MKKLTSLLAATLCVLLSATAQTPSAYSPHPFSVAATKQVVFSPGNLQCSGVQSGTYTWAFAANQWEVLGEANVTTDASGNAVLADKIDLFGYSTYAPAAWGISTSTDANDYSDSFIDWGNNVIGADKANTWYSLTCPEWQYLLGQRANAASLFAFATVNDVAGVIILPNDWVLPAGATFTPSSTLGAPWGYGYKDENKESHYADNVYTATQWQTMEAAGAVFLPTAGWRTGTAVTDLDKAGYWAKYLTTSNPRFVYINNYTCNPYGTASPWSQGNAVRLVKDYEMPREYVAKPITINMSGKQVLFSAGNLMHSISTNEWYFASKQTDYIGEANVTTDATGTQILNQNAIDLFGWSGTGSTVSYGVSLSENESDYGLTALLDYGQNSIESYAVGTYRTLSSAEWKFLLKNRPNAKKLCGFATVGTTKGLVVLPDEWVAPAGLTLVDTLGDYTVNVYTDAQWTDMEKNGAVFLPAAGWRDGSTVKTGLWYRTSTEVTGNNSVYAVWWKASTKTLSTTTSTYRYQALPVRLAQDISTYTVTVQQTENGTISADTTPAEPGTTIVVTANADAGYSLKTVVVKKGVVGVQASVLVTPVAGTDNQYQFTMPDAIVTISAVFVRNNYYAPQLISAAADKAVRFSKGNLHYKRGENVWCFADNQYDTIGAGNIIASELAEEIDLFGWSGSTATAQYGVSTSTTDADYSGTFADWGKNKIGGDAADTWRTLTPDEWNYIIRKRENADQLFAFGTVNGVKGLILLPDQWQLPQGLTFNTSSDKLVWTSTTTAKNAGKNNSSHNTYTLAQWDEMEAAGAVFLPMGGWRNGTAMETPEGGSYWMAHGTDKLAVSFTEEVLMLLNGTVAYSARNVRLVKDVVKYDIHAVPLTHKLFYPAESDQYGTIKLSTTKAEPGTEVYVTIVPKPGCTLVDVELIEMSSGDAPDSYMVNDTTHCFIMPEEEVEVRALFMYTSRYVERTISIAEDKYVCFTPGNLIAYNSTSSKSFYVADHQFDYIGTDNIKTDASGNKSLGEFIDIFGWSGGQTATKWGISTNQNVANYKGDFEDWGNNTLRKFRGDSRNYGHQCRTLSPEEWEYIFDIRTNAKALCGMATIDGIKGIVILPDDWTTPEGLQWKDTLGVYDENTYDYVQWSQMEAAGAVFLPAAGSRSGTTVTGANTDLKYHTNLGSNTIMYTVQYEPVGKKMTSYEFADLYIGCPVRLAFDVAIYDITLTTPKNGTLTVDTLKAKFPDVITITATPDENCKLYSLTVLNGVIPVPVTKIDDTHYRFDMPNAPVTISAFFSYESQYQPKAISVAADRKVLFAGGNLIKQENTPDNPWTFAGHQAYTVGYNNIYYVNQTPMSANKDEFDMFSWSTGNLKYGTIIKTSSDAEHSGDFLDWGTNIINGQPADTWYTPTATEWKYILETRADADKLYGEAVIDGVTGLVILPDEWVTPEDLTWNATLQSNQNIYTAAQWAGMEAAGAVFLPFAGYRNQQNIIGYGTQFSYRVDSVTPSGELLAMTRKSTKAGPIIDFSTTYKYIGMPVRLAKDISEYPITMGEVKNGTLSVDKTTAGVGDIVTVTLTPDEACIFRSISIVCGTKTVNFTRVNDNTCQFIMPRGTVTVSALFVCPQQYVMRPFSVAADKQVLIASGNLQYTQSTKSWAFAEFQYDTLGTKNITTNGTTATLADKIDLFGWGTGNAPTKTGTNITDYTTFTDWGTNTIGKDAANTWRTPGREEWAYLTQTRENATERYGYATVNGTKGIVLLPDEWTEVSGVACTTAGGMTTVDYAVNTYTLAQWAKMETAGAVFLPFTFSRYGVSMNNVEMGSYWSSTGSSAKAYYFGADLSGITANSISGPNGLAVRLVQDVKSYAITLTAATNGTLSASAATALPGEIITITAVPDEDYILKSIRVTKGAGSTASEVTVTKINNTTYRFVMPNGDVTIAATFLPPCRYEAYPVSVASDRRVLFSRANLQYIDNTTWQFAENQYDYIGVDNVIAVGATKILSTTIDLFGWSGESSYAPWGVSISTNNDEYKGDFLDWGTNNIEGDRDVWRTPTSDEWEYIFNKRENAKTLHFDATVVGVYGKVILPDAWENPTSLTFSTTTMNTVSAADWALMEAKGAVFLPASGVREGTDLYRTAYQGYYHTANLREGKIDMTSVLEFYDGYVFFNSCDLYRAMSVRLVKNIKKTDIDEIRDETGTTTIDTPRKILYNGQVYILYNGHIYNILGTKVK